VSLMVERNRMSDAKVVHIGALRYQHEDLRALAAFLEADDGFPQIAQGDGRARFFPHPWNAEVNACLGVSQQCSII